MWHRRSLRSRGWRGLFLVLVPTRAKERGKRQNTPWPLFFPIPHSFQILFRVSNFQSISEFPQLSIFLLQYYIRVFLGFLLPIWRTSTTTTTRNQALFWTSKSKGLKTMSSSPSSLFRLLKLWWTLRHLSTMGPGFMLGPPMVCRWDTGAWWVSLFDGHSGTLVSALVSVATITSVAAILKFVSFFFFVSSGFGFSWFWMFVLFSLRFLALIDWIWV